ncbi:FBP domain-containing protein [Pseudolysinimonas sp.]|uniref:FBP domain-containing protein n=1 Tax=Pseudolysinimonas sp. TaxID=2680009 RepID=UPI00286C4A11|nr:FBP domain-containing protein [Pseudolysinimonas sp.]
MKPMNGPEIRASMVNAAPGEAERMPLPGLHEVVWSEREYLGWRDPGSALRGYLVYWREDQPIGIALRASEVRLRAGSAICSLCNTPQPAGQVTMFSAARAGEAGRAGHSVGTYICADLACSLLIRFAQPSHDWMPDASVLLAERIEGLETRLQSFGGRVLESAA